MIHSTKTINTKRNCLAYTNKFGLCLTNPFKIKKENADKVNKTFK